MVKAFWAHLRALVSILTTRKLLLLSLLPWGTGFALFFVALAVGWIWSVSIGDLIGITNYLPRWLSGLSVAILTVIVASVLAALGTVGLSSLLLEKFMQTAIEIDVPSTTFSPQAVVVMVLTSLLQIGLLLVLGLTAAILSFIPLFAIPALLLGGFVTGLDLSLTALNIQGCTFRPALRVIFRHPLQVIVIGMPLLLPVPLLPILLLPVSAHSAATLSQEWLARRLHEAASRQKTV